MRKSQVAVLCSAILCQLFALSIASLAASDTSAIKPLDSELSSSTDFNQENSLDDLAQQTKEKSAVAQENDEENLAENSQNPNLADEESNKNLESQNPDDDSEFNHQQANLTKEGAGEDQQDPSSGTYLQETPEAGNNFNQSDSDPDFPTDEQPIIQHEPEHLAENLSKTSPFDSEANGDNDLTGFTPDTFPSDIQLRIWMGKKVS
uniref:Uncharacterized protein n=1 Tax=Ditylenchus dipsaci TaxID=166011 RepID=A0A915ETQ6_9BILA